jgi:hypothetical protein
MSQPGVNKNVNGLTIGGVDGVTKLGFFGATPVAKPVIDTSGDAAADIASIVAALVALGLATEDTGV